MTLSDAIDAALPGPVGASLDAADAADADGCHILHVDMDAFYASVEVGHRPELRGRPVLVGGAERGVVLSATYEARRFGISSGIPMSRARRLCPQAVVVSPDFTRYEATSAAVMEVFRAVTPVVEPMSADEAFLDVSTTARHYGGPVRLAERLRAIVYDEQNIACSVGIAATKFLAKLGSRAAKPDGIKVIPPSGVVAFLHPLPVDALWGVGERTAEQLHKFGLRTVADIAHTPVATLQRAFGQRAGRHLHGLAWGRDDRPVTAAPGEHSIGSDRTFGRDTDDPEVVHTALLGLATTTARRMRAASMVGRTVVLKVRFADFTTITRSRTLTDPTDVTGEILGCVLDLYDRLGLQRARIRLVGVRVQHLTDAATTPRQLRLDETGAGWREAEEAVDAAAHRFGDHLVVPARLIGQRSRPALPGPRGWIRPPERA